jgi:hypothetical protein
VRTGVVVLGFSLFLFGGLLVATYHVPNCSGIACPVVFPALEFSGYHVKNGESINAYVLAFEGNCSSGAYEVISDNGHVWFYRNGSVYVADRMGHFGIFYVPGCGRNLTVYTVNTYLSNVTPPNVTYDINGGYFTFLSDYFVPLREFHITLTGRAGFNVSDVMTIFPDEGFGTIEATYINGTLHSGDVLYRGHLRGILMKNGTKIRAMAVYDNPSAYFESRNCVEHYNEASKACRESGSPGYPLPLGFVLMVLGLGLFGYGMRR